MKHDLIPIDIENHYLKDNYGIYMLHPKETNVTRLLVERRLKVEGLKKPGYLNFLLTTQHQGKSWFAKNSRQA
jgi:hypothetical protein